MSCRCLFVSDLHGKIERYDTLFSVAEEEKPDAMFLWWEFTLKALKKLPMK